MRWHRVKNWKVVEVYNAAEVPAAIETYQKRGWCLHTYHVAGDGYDFRHYLLFEKEG